MENRVSLAWQPQLAVLRSSRSNSGKATAQQISRYIHHHHHLHNLSKSSLFLQADLAQLYLKAGLKNIGTVFLLTDAQVPDEKFLVLINDLLASGEIPDLFADDELENVINGVRNEVKGAGIMDTRENCWSFFIDRVRRQLKVVLCFSPVGSTLRVRARKFPALVNCTSINWFHEWPEEALISVSSRFLSEVELISDEVRGSISRYMAYVHKSVNAMSEIYLTNERRYNYTTPKSFLELVSIYIPHQHTFFTVYNMLDRCMFSHVDCSLPEPADQEAHRPAGQHGATGGRTGEAEEHGSPGR